MPLSIKLCNAIFIKLYKTLSINLYNTIFIKLCNMQVMTICKGNCYLNYNFGDIIIVQWPVSSIYTLYNIIKERKKTKYAELM